MQITVQPHRLGSAFQRCHTKGNCFRRALIKRWGMWLQAVRETYIELLPLTILGAMAVCIANIPYGSYLEGLTALLRPRWQESVMLVFNATGGMIGLISAMAIAGRTTTLLQRETSCKIQSLLTVSTVAGAVFLVVVWTIDDFDIHRLGYSSAFQGIVVGVATAELMQWLGSATARRTDLSMVDSGASLRRGLHLSWTAGLTLVLICSVFGLGDGLLSALARQVSGWLSPWISEHAPATVVFHAVVVAVNQLLWTAGINGGHYVREFALTGSPLIAPHLTLYTEGAASLMFTNAFAQLGGAGATWGLILCCILRGRDSSLRKLAWYSVLPALFNVNELLLFGIPLVLNTALVMPFILAPLVCCLVATAAMPLLGLTLEGQAVTWATPVLVSGYMMSGSWLGVMVQAVCLGCSVLIYAPFLKRFENQRTLVSQLNLKAAIAELSQDASAVKGRSLDRTDTVGEVARCLVRDFQADLGTSRVVLHYQPQHDAQGRVVGVESLLRWRHATYGPVPASAIVNLAEECGLIEDIDRWVVQQACADARRWRDAGYRGFKVSINMSPLQLDVPNWAQMLARVMHTHGVSCDDLDIEITEGQVMSVSEQSDKTLQEIQAMSIALSMDDFGMGCTSLLYMHRFRLYSIKLDGNLTRNVLNSTVDQDIIRCITQLGRSQGAHVVAEYVETAPQQALLKELGCDIFQGWHYSPALAPQDLPAYLDRWRDSKSQD